mgnify:CR=1 FL=1
MKVVINDHYGGFGLSDEAVELCIERGMTLNPHDGNIDNDGVYDFSRVTYSILNTKYYINRRTNTNLRCSPILISAVEELGDAANGECAHLKIIEIPFETPHGWHIEDHDGFESVSENHRTWG